jgi:predicted Zn-dependent protease
VDAWPRDALVLATTAFTNGLIGSSGRAGQKRTLLDLLESLAPIYGDDWWFTAHHGMALSENGQRDAARPKIERSLSQNPNTIPGRHMRAHLCYEEGDPNAARTFLASWLTTYPRNGALYSHLNWHLALAEKRSPPLSLVKMMKVSRPAGLRCTAAMTRPMPASRICIISP